MKSVKYIANKSLQNWVNCKEGEEVVGVSAEQLVALEKLGHVRRVEDAPAAPEAKPKPVARPAALEREAKEPEPKSVGTMTSTTTLQRAPKPKAE